MIKRTVTGSGEALKAVKNGKNASTQALGGPKASRKMTANTGYINAPVSAKAARRSELKTMKGISPSNSDRKAVSPAKETVTKGMGGRVIKEMK